MECHFDSCLFQLKERGICGLPNKQLDSSLNVGNQLGISFVVESLEIGRVLADQAKTQFRSQGSCMYPSIKSNDTLFIESRSIQDVKVGDIAVFRRFGQLLGHRTIGKGEDKGGAYIVTRPDRSTHGNDGPTYSDNILGIVVKIDRRGHEQSIEPKPLKGYSKVQVLFWEWWNLEARPYLIKNVEVVQKFGVYNKITSLYLTLVKRRLIYNVRMPLKPMQTHDLYRNFSPEEFDVNKVVQKGSPVAEWTLTLFLIEKRYPIAWITIIRHPENCPLGEGWYIADLFVRIRYRGIGFEKQLVSKAKNILARSGTVLKQSDG